MTFGDSAAQSFAIISDSEIVAIAPPGAGSADVQVTDLADPSPASSADSYTWLDTPTVAGLSPASGPVAGGTALSISGSGFTGVTSVVIGGTPAAFTVKSDTLIAAVSPPGSGTIDVTVTGPGGISSGSAANLFTYT